MTLRWMNIGDLHLGRLDTLFPNGRGLDIQIEQLRKQCVQARDEGIKHLFVLGDVFNTPFPAQDHIRRFIRVVHEFDDLKWWVIAGNHDIHSADTHGLAIAELTDRLGLLPNLRVFVDPKRTILRGIPVDFLPFPHARPRKDGPSLVVAHVEYAGAKQDNGRLSPDGEEHPPSLSYTVSGHLHTEQTLPRVYYPGTALPFTFGETQDKSVTISAATLNGRRLGVTHETSKVDLPYRLLTVKVEHDGDLMAVPDEPGSDFYRLALHNPAVVIPQGWLAARPHVVGIIGKFKTDDGQPLEIRSFDIRATVRKTLRKALPKPLRKAATRLLDEALRQVED